MLRESARQEFESARHERDPEMVSYFLSFLSLCFIDFMR